MELGTVRALRGPNIWGSHTALEAQARIGSSQAPSTSESGASAGASESLAAVIPWTSAEVGAARKRVLNLWPGLIGDAAQVLHFDYDHWPQGESTSTSTNASDDADDDGTSLLSPGLALAELLVQVAVGLQCRAGSLVYFGRARETNEAGLFRVAVEYREEPVGRLALSAACDLCNAVLAGQPFDADERLRELRRLDQKIRLGPSTGSIVRAAMARGIPARRLNDASLVQLGHGSKQHRILAAETDKTSAVAEAIVQDKELTKSLLASIGVPVPKGRLASDELDAWEAAQEIGLPVVVKPKDGNQGRGVAVNLTTREQVLAAFAAAKAEEDDVIVEKFAPGGDYRLLVVGHRLIAAARREPPKVVGDGRRTIEQLVHEVNLDPRRGEDHATSLSKIPLDEIARGVLTDQGLTASSIPAAGQVVLLRRNANLSTGGSATDVTDLVHPEVASRVIEGVRMVGLDVAGVDVVAADISRPLEDQGGVIVEINAAPGLRMHLEPSYGKGRPVGEAIVGTMFPNGDDGRIPLVSVTGTNGKTTTTRMIAHLLRSTGKRVGMTCTDGVYINDRRVDTGDCSGPKSARMVLANPLVDAAVLETARGGILREGLGYDRSHVAVVTNIAEGDHLGLNGIDTAEQLARVKRVIVENVAPEGYAVLNAADPLVAHMADYCPGKTLFFARQADHPVLEQHRARGGKVVYVQQGFLVAAEGNWEARICSLKSVPLTFGGLIGFQVENTLAAAAAGWALGLPLEVIRIGLETFINNSQTVPARFNVVQFRESTIVIDYGHNASALSALLEAFEQIHHQRRLIVYTAAGDRRDEDIIRQAEIIAAGFDEIVIYEDQCTRGRADGEVIRLMREGLQRGPRIRQVYETRGEMVAIEMVLRQMQSGDLVLIQADQVDDAIRFIEGYLAGLPAVESQARQAASSVID